MFFLNVNFTIKEMTRKNEFLVDDGISYLLKADDTHVWAYSQTKKTLTIYPTLSENSENISETSSDVQSPELSESFTVESFGENSEGSEGRPSSSGSSRPGSAVRIFYYFYI